jgi:hypothetical protein
MSNPTPETLWSPNDIDKWEGVSQCLSCHVLTFNGDNHVCTVYDGPACQVCGAGTVSGFYGAPGVGRFTTCKNGHGAEYGMGDHPHILTLEETR